MSSSKTRAVQIKEKKLEQLVGLKLQHDCSFTETKVTKCGSNRYMIRMESPKEMGSDQPRALVETYNQLVGANLVSGPLYESSHFEYPSLVAGFNITDAVAVRMEPDRKSIQMLVDFGRHEGAELLAGLKAAIKATETANKEFDAQLSALKGNLKPPRGHVVTQQDRRSTDDQYLQGYPL